MSGMDTRSVVTYQTPLGISVRMVRHTFAAFRPGNPRRRIAFIAGLHGDEFEGLYVCHLLLRYLQELKHARPEAFLGEIHVYPAANPQALGNGARLWPFFSTDMNRQMAGDAPPSLPAAVARNLLADIKNSADLAVDLHASNQHLSELPQIRIPQEFEKTLTPLARLCDVDVIWVHPLAPALETTIGCNLNRAGIPTLVVETGICLRIHRSLGERIFGGLLRLMRHAGILAADNDAAPAAPPQVIGADGAAMVQANRAGLFIGRAALGARVNAGDLLGEVVDAASGAVLEEAAAPAAGLLFTLREHPLVYPGALLARVARDKKDVK